MHTVIKLKKQDGKLISQSTRMKTQFTTFVNSLQEGDVVESYFEKITDNVTSGQLALVHLYIRRLAHHTGTTFEGIKLEIKRRSGLFTIVTIGEQVVMNLRSFGNDCSADDLSLAIQACIELGEEVNYILN